MFSLVSDTPDPELADPDVDPESDEVCSKIYPSLCTYTHKNNRVSLFQCKLQITIGTLLWGKIICYIKGPKKCSE